MCYGGECPIKEKCYRYRAKPDKYMQSYFVSPPYLNNKEIPNSWFDKPTKEQLTCEHYLDASKWMDV